MPWTVLLFAAGSLAIPAPSILLVPLHPSSQKDPIHIVCTAPKDFLGANFTLYCGGQVVQLLQAPAGQLGVTFNLSGNSSEAPGGAFHCQYSVIGEHSQPQLSDFSKSVYVSFPGNYTQTTWLEHRGESWLPKVKVTNLQKKRERESCWAQINFTPSDMSFDNSLFVISMKMVSEEDSTTLDAKSSSTAASSISQTWKRPTSTSTSLESPEFSTFRAPL
ncbi:protein HIDE1 isoform 2-T2 [Dugong dugon]